MAVPPLVFYYVFHLSYTKLDFFHAFHHVMTITAELLVFKYVTTIEEFQMYNIQHIMLVSSVFSALRKLSYHEGWNNKVFWCNLYYRVFLFIKILGNAVFWYRWYLLETNAQYMPVFCIISIVQMYFCVVIVGKLRKQKHQ
jgi:hypothetical protein